MNDTILIPIVLIGIATWSWLGAAEIFYNRCKRRKARTELSRAVDTLSSLSRRHDGWEHGVGRCQCDEHRAARLVVRNFNEYGRRK